MIRLFKRTLVTLLIFAGLVSAWVAYDLLRPLKVNISDFDANEVAQLDTAMWRSYYERERFRMYWQLTELLATQYKFPFWRRQLVALCAVKAAFVFKDGQNREDYEKALPDLIRFYDQIHDVSTTEFDAKHVAQLELEWWIVHRQRTEHKEGDLAMALADAASSIYQMPAEKFAEYGEFRAKAMDIRDIKAETNGLTEEDWQKIDELLHLSWRSLHDAVTNDQ